MYFKNNGRARDDKRKEAESWWEYKYVSLYLEVIKCSNDI